MGLRPGRTKGPWVGVSGGSGGDIVAVSPDDTTPGYLEDKIVEGLAQNITLLDPAGDEKLELTDGIAGFRDTFITEKPFWSGSDPIVSGQWEIDTANEWMIGISGSGTDRAVVREGIEGDFDYAFHFTHDEDVSTKITVEGNSITATLGIVSGDLNFEVSGETTETIALPYNPIWLRLKRYGRTHLAAYYREADTDPWILMLEYDDKDMGESVTLYLDAAVGSKVHEVVLYDNMFPIGVRSYFAKREVPLTDAANIDIDASAGNFFSVTLGGSRTVNAPTNPQPNQLMLLRVKQDGTGSRTLSWNAVFSFSADLPSPTLTTTAGRTDLLGFLYNKALNKWLYIAEVKDFNV